MINPFIPEFLKWTLLSLNLDISTDAKRGLSQKQKNRMANSVDADDMACYKPSHLDLHVHCLHRYLFWSARLKGLVRIVVTTHTIDLITTQTPISPVKYIKTCVESTQKHVFVGTHSKWSGMLWFMKKMAK